MPAPAAASSFRPATPASSEKSMGGASGSGSSSNSIVTFGAGIGSGGRRMRSSSRGGTVWRFSACMPPPAGAARSSPARGPAAA